MIKIRRSHERGHDDKSWLDTYHTFSFDTYYDPEYKGYRSLLVLNEDRVKEKKGFSAHMHKDMEIITYVIEGVLEHKDSMGNSSLIRAGEVQRMSAGTGVVHSETNPSMAESVHFLQIWIYPAQHGIAPSYEQKFFSSAAKYGQWCLLASTNGRNGSILIHQDTDLYSTVLDIDEEMVFEALTERFYWIQIVSGAFDVEGSLLETGDGAALNDLLSIRIKCTQGGEFLLFDLA